MKKNKIAILVAFIPLIMLIVSIIVFILNTRIAEGKPYIEKINPNIIERGNILEIRGKNFGDEREGSKVYVSTIDLISKYIISWSDSLIQVVIPEKANSGLVVIETSQGESGPVVIVLSDSIPYIGTGAYLPGFPFIEMIDPAEGGAGSVITISGDNFGFQSNNSKILFSSAISREREGVAGDSSKDNFLSVSNQDIISWNNKEIALYLPDLVETGNVYIKSESGYSNAFYFENRIAGHHLEMVNKKSYIINQTVQLDYEGSSNEAMMNLWFPLPTETIYQRNRAILSSSHPSSTFPVGDINLYKINVDSFPGSLSLSQNITIDVFERCNIINPSEYTKSYDTDSPLYIKYTKSSDLIPSSLKKIRDTASSITRRKRGSYDKGRAIYDYILARLDFDETVVDVSPDSIIEIKKGDSKGYSLLFCSLARSIGIPARPVSGFIVGANDYIQKHWWIEMYIEGYGWFSADPALGDGIEQFNIKDKPVEYYWGNIDNHHIIFNRGEKSIPKLFPDGIIYGEDLYANQTHAVETDNKVSSLSADWSDIFITTIY